MVKPARRPGDLDKETPAARPFSDFLVMHHRGKNDHAIGEALAHVNLAVKETKKNGKVTIVVTVAPMKDRDDMLVTAVEVKETVPEINPPKVYFTDASGNPTEQDPMQPSIPGIMDTDEFDGPRNIRQTGDE
jgi:hypothetical protein